MSREEGPREKTDGQADPPRLAEDSTRTRSQRVQGQAGEGGAKICVWLRLFLCTSEIYLNIVCGILLSFLGGGEVNPRLLMLLALAHGAETLCVHCRVACMSYLYLAGLPYRTAHIGSPFPG